MEEREFDFDFILDCLIGFENISFARNGDGELNSVLAKRGENCDAHIYFPDMGIELKKILESQPKYYLGLQRLGAEQNADNAEFQKLRDMNTWVNNEVFTRPSAREGKVFLEKFKGALAERRVIQVANESLLQLQMADVFIEIPLINCWLKKDQILKSIRENIQENDVILYSASMPTKYFINEIYKEYGNKVTQLDCGSVFDVYVGRITRTYMKNIVL